MLGHKLDETVIEWDVFGHRLDETETEWDVLGHRLDETVTEWDVLGHRLDETVQHNLLYIHIALLSYYHEMNQMDMLRCLRENNKQKTQEEISDEIQ